MMILGPLPWSTTSAVIRAAPRAAASEVTDPASSTRSTAGSATDSPGAAVTRLTSSVSQTAALCWGPPVRAIGYTERLLEAEPPICGGWDLARGYRITPGRG